MKDSAVGLRELVTEVGERLGRSSSDVEPLIQSLEENWYDSPESLADVTADDLVAIGLPRRFAVELANAAAGAGGDSKSDRREPSGRSSSRPEGGKSKAKGKGKDKDRDGKGKGKAKARDRDRDLEHVIPVDLQGTDPSFKFRPKLLGAKGANIHHIQDQTGVRVDLRGDDTEGSMEFVLRGSDNDSLDQATAMCEDLLWTVFEQYEQEGGEIEEEKAGKGDRKGKGKSKGKGKKGKDRDDDDRKGKGKGKKGKSKGRPDAKVPCSPSANGVDDAGALRIQLVGEQGRNVKHIEAETGTTVVVEGYNDDMVFAIWGRGGGSDVELAREMCEDLLATILDEVGGRSGSKRGREGKGRKGKGKGKGRDEDDRPRKSARTY
eukprot:TRINITY_DN37430_c0_g1_i1.p1 TRINITY_DN37430_c0_g1~~TRINITY_DN37430_c0_g1_i1.p1  ORF type:complete len:436 (+),score=98.21 TRINITY_DN37430_c0_g1_i1:177-1310(+)